MSSAAEKSDNTQPDKLRNAQRICPLIHPPELRDIKDTCPLDFPPYLCARQDGQTIPGLTGKNTNEKYIQSRGARRSLRRAKPESRKRATDEVQHRVAGSKRTNHLQF